jgi:integrase
MSSFVNDLKMSSRARNKLTVKQVTALPGPKVYSDGGGLYLRVRPSGRSWFYFGMLDGKRFELGLGSSLDVTLAKAREKAAVIREQVLDKRDPRAERAKAKAARVMPVTFGEFAKALIADIESGFKNEKHRWQWRTTIFRDANSLLEKPIDAIGTDDVLDVIKPIWLTKHETASRLRGRIERVLDSARVKGLRDGENPARWRGHLELLLPRKPKNQVKHHAALPFAEISVFMPQLRAREDISARALEFTILTAARSNEVIGMTWSEVDFESKVWAVPASRMKAGVEHQVPLSEAAITILKAVKPASSSIETPVFTGKPGKPLSNMAMSMLLRRMEFTEITVHGFRSCFRDFFGETVNQFEREIVEMALAHTLGSSVERAYRRGRALEKRRALMAAWADYCGGKPVVAQLTTEVADNTANR